MQWARPGVGVGIVAGAATMYAALVPLAGPHVGPLSSLVVSLTLLVAARSLWRARRAATGRVRTGLTYEVLSLVIGTVAAGANSAVISSGASGVAVEITVGLALIYMP